jgi:phage terminase large subunit
MTDELDGYIEEAIDLPFEWDPRPHQRKLWTYMQGGGKRAVAVWHRRAGKDSTALNFTARAMHERVGTYWHLLPEAAQARKAIWTGIDKLGRRIIDQAFPDSLRSSTRNNEMAIDFKCGSIWQLAGSDNFNSLVGANPIGVVFSEYSIANPAAWDYLRPILLENDGWAMFIYTPRGKNHGKKIFDMARKNPAWFCELLTVEDTHLVSPQAIQEERESGMDDDMIQQEYFCGWEGSRVGSIYGSQLAKARAEGRITSVPYDRRYPVHTFWDIGHSDATAIWFYQQVGMKDCWIRSYEAAGRDVGHFVQYLQSTGYVYGQHYLPHDAKNVVLASANNPIGANVWDQLRTMGMQEANMVKVDRTPDVWTAINATRLRWDSCWFDSDLCESGLNAMASYRKEWSDERQCFADKPYHDWASNFADAFRQWAQGYIPAGTTKTFTRPVSVGPNRQTFQTVRTVGNRKVGY